MIEPHLTLRRDDGTVYLHRWYLLPRGWPFSIYLHKFVGDDDDRGLHDHPYDNVSIPLSRAGYEEVVPVDCTRLVPRGLTEIKHRRWLVPVRRRAEDPHRVLLTTRVTPDGGVEQVPCWSLFLRGRRRRDWGFYLPTGWVSNSVIQPGYTGYGEQTVSTRGRRTHLAEFFCLLYPLRW